MQSRYEQSTCPVVVETTVLILDAGRTALTPDSGGAPPVLKALGVGFYSGLILAGEGVVDVTGICQPPRLRTE